MEFLSRLVKFKKGDGKYEDLDGSAEMVNPVGGVSADQLRDKDGKEGEKFLSGSMTFSLHSLLWNLH